MLPGLLVGFLTSIPPSFIVTLTHVLPFLFIFIYLFLLLLLLLFLFIFIFIGNIVLGPDHLLGGHQVLPSNYEIDKCLPLSFQ
jgi:hypothetical protein